VWLTDALTLADEISPDGPFAAAGPHAAVVDEVRSRWAGLRLAVRTGEAPDDETAVLVRLLRLYSYFSRDTALRRVLWEEIWAPIETEGRPAGRVQVARLLDHELWPAIASMMPRPAGGGGGGGPGGA
jgi:hypothetical protein